MRRTEQNRMLWSLGLLLGMCMPAAAQSHYLSSRYSPSASPTLTASLETVAPVAMATVLDVPIRHSSLRNASAKDFARLRSIPAAMPTFAIQFHAAPSLARLHYAGDQIPITGPESRGHDRSASLQSEVDILGTPFAEQIRLPLLALWGGRLELACFDSQRRMVNILLGPPGAGGLPAGSISKRAHAGAWALRSTRSYGLSLSIRLKRS